MTSINSKTGIFYIYKYQIIKIWLINILYIETATRKNSKNNI